QLGSIAGGIDRVLYQGLAAMGSASRGDVDSARRAVQLLSETECKAFRARALDLLGRSLLGTDRAAAGDAPPPAAVAFEACGAAWGGDRARTTLRAVGARGRRLAASGLGPSGLS